MEYKLIKIPLMSEIENHIKSYEGIVEQYLNNGISSYELLKGMSSRGGQIIRLYQAGLCSEVECQNGLAELHFRLDKATKQAEVNRLNQIVQKLNAETLTTDTKGFRNANWFEGGKTFLTGEASNCVVCAIYHPDLGMAASHRNTVGIESFRIRALKIMRNEPVTDNYTDMVPSNVLRDTIKLTINEAFSEFRNLDLGVFPSSGTQVLVCGVSQIHQLLKRDTVKFTINTVYNHPDITSDNREKDLVFREEIGRDLGVAYGKKYSQPEFYSLKIS